MRRFDYPAPPPSEITPEPVYRARRQLMGLGLYVLFVVWAHAFLFGVRPFG